MLEAGTKLGPYEIQSQLGAGGMGEVYRALDTRLNRTVAVKVLASGLSASSEFRQRMEREARAISSLNHPHICQLYDIGSQDGADFLVMEFLEGETLAERLKRGALPLSEICRIGIGIAEALSSAHRQGIVHRDLKPGNIMLTQGGAKLMDFGLAKPLNMASAGSSSKSAPPSFTAVATLSGPSPLSPLTTAGSIVGTIQYMSPEQIEGKEADARSDIFAFGAVLFEMATGKRPFEGKSQISLASAILEKDPDPVSKINATLPPALDRLVATCLQKNPEDRFETAHDVKLELQWVATDKPVAQPEPTVIAPPASKKSARLGWIAGLAVALVIGALAGMFLLQRSTPARTLRTLINPPEKTTLVLTGDFAGPPVLSPDGSNLIFTAQGQDSKTMLWLRPMDSTEARAIPGTENATFPFWSPDSKSVGFFADSKLKIVDVNASAPQVLADAEFGRGGAWAQDGTIIFSPGTQTPLMKVSALGGNATPQSKIDLNQYTSHRWPFMLPDGKHFLYLAINHDPSKAGNNAIFYASLDGREDRLLLRTPSNAIYAAGYLLFGRGDQLMAQPFDPDKGVLNGSIQGVAKAILNDVTTWHMDVSAADNGLLVTANGGSANWQLVWLDREGKQVGVADDKLPDLVWARISPQGDRVALQIDVGQSDIWILDLARKVRTRLTFGPVQNNYPEWSPDGKWIVYNSDRNGHASLIRKPADGSGAEEELYTDSQSVIPSDWTHDGKHLIYSRGQADNADLWDLPLDGSRKPRLLVPRVGNSSAYYGRVSPDGKWLAYTSTESGTIEVYIKSFEGGAGKWQVSGNGGELPQWSTDGKELYYLDRTFTVLTVPVKEAGDALQFGAAQPLVAHWTAPNVYYDVNPDGKKLLMQQVSQQVGQSITVTTNFNSALKK